MKILTDEKFASISAMIEQGISKAEIAAICGVTSFPLTLKIREPMFSPAA